MSVQTQFDSIHDEWIFALDLLIARATLDEELRSSLLKASQQTCLSNGVMIPEGIQVVITRADQPTLIREIPTTLPTGSYQVVAVTSDVREPAVYNSADVTTAETTTEAITEAVVTNAEAFAAIDQTVAVVTTIT